MDIYEQLSMLDFDAFERLAAKKSKKKLDPNAKVRNRGKCVFPANSSKLKDHSKDRYPINNIGQARSALSYAGKQKSAPWYNGTVAEMKSAVQRAVHKAFPAIKSEKKSKKSEVEVVGLEKFAALKEKVDRYIFQLERWLGFLGDISKESIDGLVSLRSKYTETFDPELEHIIIKQMPKLEKDVITSAKQIQNIRFRINDFLKAVHNNTPIVPTAPISTEKI